jgi:deazaflavin-dependent oxidoreductase (nitroreductase family)
MSSPDMLRTDPSFTRPPVGGLQRLLLKTPALAYHGPLAELLKWRCVMLLITRGRKTGRPRTGAVSFMPLDGHYVVFSGWGVSSNWYRNVRANPNVLVTVGTRRFPASAWLVDDPERRRELMLRMQARSKHCGPPLPIRPLLKAAHLFDYEAEIEMAVAAGGELPVLEIFPTRTR